MSTAPTRILVHDYSGHPFQVQLSRELARRGNEVLHLHCSSFVTGKGALERRADDPDGFRAEPVDLGERFEKYSWRKRLWQERRYGRICASRIEAFRPDVVLSSNTPLFAQGRLLRAARRTGARFVFWQQDVYSIAMKQAVRRGVPVIGGALGAGFERLERSLLGRSDLIVVISEDFLPILDAWGIRQPVEVIENWAPLDELPVEATSTWAQEHGLQDKPFFLYSGTLGLKHDPQVLLALATRFQQRGDARLVVVSEGLGADWLRERGGDLPALVQLPFQPYDRLADMLGSAAALIAILEADAGVFSVPSKVLSYHCAGRPILASVPAANLAARIVEAAGSGRVVQPGDTESFVAAAEEMLQSPGQRDEMGRRARAHASRAFDIRTITDRFEAALAAPTIDDSTLPEGR